GGRWIVRNPVAPEDHGFGGRVVFTGMLGMTPTPLGTLTALVVVALGTAAGTIEVVGQGVREGWIPGVRIHARVPQLLGHQIFLSSVFARKQFDAVVSLRIKYRHPTMGERRHRG